MDDPFNLVPPIMIWGPWGSLATQQTVKTLNLVNTEFLLTNLAHVE
jgi:hypothetical protein